MLFQEPKATPYDIRFSFLGFPVRVHPAFFIIPILLGGSVFQYAQQLEVNVGVCLLVLIAVFFVSILVHELGHTLAFRSFGVHSHVLLYWLGGLAIPDSMGSWSAGRTRSLTSNQKVIVSLAGPFAGFCLAGAFAGFVYLLGGRVEFIADSFIPTLIPHLEDSRIAGNGAMFIFLWMGLWANIFWNVLNLAPIFPLDGGQVARELFTQFDPSNGLRYSLILSIVVGALIAIRGLSSGDHFMAFFFGYMAWVSYQSLQQLGGGFGGGYGGGNPW